MSTPLRWLLDEDQDSEKNLELYDPQYTSSSKEDEELAIARLEWLRRRNPQAASNVRILTRPDGSLVINQATATMSDLDVMNVPKTMADLSDTTLRYLEDLHPEADREGFTYDRHYVSLSREVEALTTARLAWWKANNKLLTPPIRVVTRPDGTLVVNPWTYTVEDLDLYEVPTDREVLAKYWPILQPNQLIVYLDSKNGLTTGLDTAEIQKEEIDPEDPEQASTRPIEEWVPKAGELVYLRSGSPEMTVSQYFGIGDTVEVVWHDGNTFSEYSFPRVCLTPNRPLS